MRRSGVATWTTLAALLLAVVAASPATADNNCWDQGYKTAYDRVGRLGGPNKIAGPVKSPAELAELLRAEPAIWNELVELMNQKGQGDVADLLYGAIQSGNAEVAPILEGQVYQWMAFKKRGSPKTSRGAVCMVVPDGRYTSYNYEVVQVGPVMADKMGDFGLLASNPEPGVVRLEVTGNAEGVDVVGPDGPITLSGGSWTQNIDESEDARTMEFTASRANWGTQTETPHRFAIPPACVNLSYIGAGPTQTKKVELDPTHQSASVAVPATIRASCEISVEPETVKRKGSVVATVSGEFDEVVTVVIGPDGSEITTFSGTSSGPIKLKKKGAYTFRGKATRGSKTATCSAEAWAGRRPKGAAVAAAAGACHEHGSGSWILRPFASYLGSSGSSVFTSSFRADGTNERSQLELADGSALGVSLERLFGNCRAGLEGTLIAGNLDAKLFFDLDEAWDHDDEDLGFLAFTLGPNFHLTPNSNVDLYFGPFVGYVTVDDVSFSVLGETQRRNFEDGVTFGAQLGLDIPFGGSAWGLHLGTRFLEISSEVSDIDTDLDTLTADLGLAFRF